MLYPIGPPLWRHGSLAGPSRRDCYRAPAEPSGGLACNMTANGPSDCWSAPGKARSVKIIDRSGPVICLNRIALSAFPKPFRCMGNILCIARQSFRLFRRLARAHR